MYVWIKIYNMFTKEKEKEKLNGMTLLITFDIIFKD
jgi:hypothetical protein